MSQAAITPYVPQAGNVLGQLATQVTFNRVGLGEVSRKFSSLPLSQIAGLHARVKAECFADVQRGLTAHAVDLGQCDLKSLVGGDVDPDDTCHLKVLVSAVSDA